MRSHQRPPHPRRVEAGQEGGRAGVRSSVHEEPRLSPAADPRHEAGGAPAPVRRRFRRASPVAVAAALALTLAACGGGDEESENGDGDAGSEEHTTADQLHEAQLSEFGDLTQAADGGEAGTYSDLTTVQYSAEIRDSTELDKPECIDAANRWAGLDPVQDAPASVATYEWEKGAVTSMLVQLPPEEAAEALTQTPPQECGEYTATHEDGSSSDYSISDLGIDELGDESHAHTVDVETDGELNSMRSVLYRNGDVLGTTSVIGAGESAEYEEMLVDFTEAAIEHQEQILG